MLNHLFVTLLLCALPVRANLPTEASLLKAAAGAVRRAALDYADNPSHEGAESLRTALAKAQAQGVGGHFPKAQNLSETQLGTFSKYIQVADVCSIDLFDNSGLHQKSFLVKVPKGELPSPEQVASYLSLCKAATKAVAVPIKPSGAGQ